ncbi:MAG: D-inositol-3-phosphate glycosyltransferase [candidate division WS6 bacterium OLB20]|uniref:D-inositol-3-phosphate glycosyltransferase n=1 Tax=candidate division WS6 bacterium OLB20 TaxID=1617426 RepID=A0A136LW08_9BACT|nr:MAG: D-inositol-3-phosphate glycosyltransferase [candidate division WS6 bacterium OLB20]
MHIQIVGPAVSEYSLARVNRLLARHLALIPDTKVTLYAPELLAGRDVRPADLDRYPWLREMYVTEQGRPDVQIFCAFPKSTGDSLGLQALTAPHRMIYLAWEETGFPSEWVDEINRHITVVLAPSVHVARVLERAGVNRPVSVIPLGIEKVTPDKAYQTVTDAECTFLHISSGHARKGLDVLLDAYEQAFTGGDNTLLVLKLFPNPNLDLDAIRSRFATTGKPRLQLIDDPELTDSQIAALYQQADCVVLPTRAEGFGLPMAEAMQTGALLITTGYSGQMDFCDERSALLLPYKLVPAVESHHGLPGSMWAQPDTDALAKLMKRVYKNPDGAEFSAMREQAKKNVADLTWENTASAVAAVAAQLPRLSSLSVKRAAVVSPIHTPGGVAEYTRELYQPLRSVFSELRFFADIAVPVTEDPAVDRCWNGRDTQTLTDRLKEYAPDILHIQYHTDFFTPEQLGMLLAESAGHTDMYVTLHIVPEGLPVAALEQCRTVWVHSVADQSRMHAAGLENVRIAPHGIPDALPRPADQLRDRLGIPHQPVVATHGLLHDRKGVLELVDSLPMLLNTFPDMLLLLVSAVSSANSTSQGVSAQLHHKIKDLQLEHHVVHISDFLSFPEVVTMLQLADLIVLPYHELGEGTSGAARTAMAAVRPMVTSDIGMFAEVPAHRISDSTPVSIAGAVAEVLNDKSLLDDLRRQVRDKLELQAWRRVSYEYAISLSESSASSSATLNTQTL